VFRIFNRFGIVSPFSLFVAVLLIGGIFVGVRLTSRTQNIASQAKVERKIG
jgi:hypothetical protein